MLDAEYLDRGLALHESLELYCRPFHWHVLALDGKGLDSLTRLSLPDTTITPMWEFETAELRKRHGRRRWNEYVWTCKPFWILRVLNVGMNDLTYVDGDCMFFSHPGVMYAEIGKAHLAITPHRFSPEYSKYVMNGRFNGAFIYTRQNKIAMDCLQEWAQNCLDWCFLSYEGDKFVDQKYLDQWPGRWGAYAITNKGTNLAPWNQLQYQYALAHDSIYVSGDRLVFYHFHQGTAPAYPLHSFVQQHIYSRYEEALIRARARLAR